MKSSFVVRPLGDHSADLDVLLKVPEGRYAHLVIDIVDEDLGGGAGAVTVTIQGKDPTGKAYTILASASLATVATTVLKVGPGLTAAANAVANDFVPCEINVNINHTNANPMRYSIGLNLA